MLESFYNCTNSYCDSKYDSDELKQQRNKGEVLLIEPERRNKYSDRKKEIIHTHTTATFVQTIFSVHVMVERIPNTLEEYVSLETY